MSGSGEVWLIRHAETEWSLSGQHTGRTDLPLTDSGRQKARALAPRLAEQRFAAVLSSPLARARDTCELAGLTGAQLRDDLMEVDYGENEGRTTEEIRETIPGWTVWRDGNRGGESVDEVGDRVDRVIAEAIAVEGDVALVAHGHVLRILAARWLEESAAFGERLPLATAAVCVLGFERDARALERWNS